MLAHVRRKKSLARGIEQDRGAMLDQGANLIEFGLGEPRGRDWMRFHVRRSAPAPVSIGRRIAEIAVSDSLPPALSTASLPLQKPIRRAAPIANGIAPAPR